MARHSSFNAKVVNSKIDKLKWTLIISSLLLSIISLIKSFHVI